MELASTSTRQLAIKDYHRCQLFLEKFRDILATPTPHLQLIKLKPSSQLHYKSKVQVVACNIAIGHMHKCEWHPQPPPTTFISLFEFVYVTVTLSTDHHDDFLHTLWCLLLL